MLRSPPLFARKRVYAGGHGSGRSLVAPVFEDVCRSHDDGRTERSSPLPWSVSLRDHPYSFKPRVSTTSRDGAQRPNKPKGAYDTVLGKDTDAR